MSKAIRRALYGKLAGDTTLNGFLADPPHGYSKSIFHQVAPEGAPYPYVVFQKQAGTPSYTLASEAYLSDVWLIKVLDRGSTSDTADDAASRLVALLTDASLSISGLSLMYLRRDSDVEYSEETDGVVYHHAGALWRVVTQSP